MKGNRIGILHTHVCLICKCCKQNSDSAKANRLLTELQAGESSQAAPAGLHHFRLWVREKAWFKENILPGHRKLADQIEGQKKSSSPMWLLSTFHTHHHHLRLDVEAIPVAGLWPSSELVVEAVWWSECQAVAEKPGCKSYPWCNSEASLCL